MALSKPIVLISVFFREVASKEGAFFAKPTVQVLVASKVRRREVTGYVGVEHLDGAGLR